MWYTKAPIREHYVRIVVFGLTCMLTASTFAAEAATPYQGELFLMSLPDLQVASSVK